MKKERAPLIKWDKHKGYLFVYNSNCTQTEHLLELIKTGAVGTELNAEYNWCIV